MRWKLAPEPSPLATAWPRSPTHDAHPRATPLPCRAGPAPELPLHPTGPTFVGSTADRQHETTLRAPPINPSSNFSESCTLSSGLSPGPELLSKSFASYFAEKTRCADNGLDPPSCQLGMLLHFSPSSSPRARWVSISPPPRQGSPGSPPLPPTPAGPRFI